MKIVQVSPYSWDAHGGVQAHIRQLAARLESRGHHATVLAPGKPPNRRVGVRIVGRAVPVRVNESVARICFSPQSARAVERALRELRPDVIHVHEPLVPSSSMFAVLRANAPVVATFHANVPSDKVRSVLFRLAVPFIRPVWERLDRRVAVSEAARASVALRLGEAPLEIVPNGSDFDRFASAAAAHLPPGRHLLFVGRLEKRKGFPVALDAFAHLAPHYPDLRFLVVGDGPDRGAVEQLPASLRRRVDMVGRVSDEKLPSYYRAADVFVGPALGSESFGIVLVEAMAAGLSVVASDISGYRDVARHGREALLVPPGDPTALADAIRRLLDNPSLAHSLGVHAARRAREFDWAVVADRLEAIYEEVVQRRWRRRAWPGGASLERGAPRFEASSG